MILLPAAVARALKGDGTFEQVWFDLLANIVRFANGPTLPAYTVASAPRNAATGALIIVTDESGGAQPAFWDGSNWRRVTDRAVIS